MRDVGKDSLLRWQGVMADSPIEVRRASIGFLAILACAMVATQTNYFVIGGTHLIAAIAPITTCALLFGPLPAVLVGALAGTAEMIHAQLLPLDIYERYFAAPVNSIVLFALMGLVMGLMFARASSRIEEDERRGLPALVVICAIGSALFTLLFSVSVNAINSLLNFEIPSEILADFTSNHEVVSQILVNFAMMVALSLAAASLYRRRSRFERERTLRSTFQGWLAVVVSSAYLLTASLGYSAVSAVCRSSAEQQMQGQIDYLTYQLSERDKLLEGVARRAPITDAVRKELQQTSVSGLASNLPTSEGGVVALAVDGVIVSSNVSELVGEPFADVVAGGMAEGFDQALYDQARSTYWYFSQDLRSTSGASRLGFVRVAQSEAYQMMAALPASEVFAWRPWLMVAISVAFLSLFTAIYAQASLLLRNVVVDKIDETNETLSLITQGDLNQQVTVSEPSEFAKLSRGINATVGSLKEAIAAESSRIEGDLLTARTIQESALPRNFPPFPEIEDFDIYASMTPAREVGGDFYDFFLVGDHTLGFLIADVSGKGIPASLFMMAAKAQLARYVSSGMPLSDAVQTANWHLCQGNDADMFMTAWIATLDWKSGLLTFVNAGHNPPLLRHNGTWNWIKTKGGPLLGSFESARFHSTAMTLTKRDQLLLYTDGVNEAFGADGAQYGDHRLERLCAANTQLHPRELINAVSDDVKYWSEGAEQSDDITMLSLEYGVAPETRGEMTVPAELANLEKVIEMIHEELDRRYCPIVTQHQIDIAVEELFVNVCNYAYAEEEKVGPCQVSYLYRPDPNTITISITDWGTPFDPLKQEDPTLPSSVKEAKIGGLGIFMAKRLTDELTYRRDNDKNVVTFKKRW
ncbi:MAG: SpoIIE family protein phosphatase [Atopobiaceae bacterium]|nr:SpoIIE family protein phosphatase [Atopobiaceae bacterium]